MQDALRSVHKEELLFPPRVSIVEGRYNKAP